MDRLLQRNVLAMSGRAVEAAGDIDVLLLDKTGTITLGNRQATEFLPAPGVDAGAPGRRRPARLAGRRDARGHAASSCWPRRSSSCAAATSPAARAFVPFTAQTRMSGVDVAPTGGSRPGRSARAPPQRPRLGRVAGRHFPTAVDGTVDDISARAARRWWWPRDARGRSA